MSVGDSHACAVFSATSPDWSGSVKCWGDNHSGQLGDGSAYVPEYYYYLKRHRPRALVASRPNTSPVPVTVAGISNAKWVSSGRYHSCAVVGAGNVSCWGSNSYGQLGDGTTTGRRSPVSVTGITNAVTVSAGDDTTCALLADTTVKCWGGNNNGLLGTGLSMGSLAGSRVPVSVVPEAGSGVLSGVVQLDVGPARACVVRSDGKVYCWGVRAGAGGATRPEAISGIEGATEVNSSQDHTCATLSSGTVKCWGFVGTGQLGFATPGSFFNDVKSADTVTGLSGAVAVSLGFSRSCAVVQGVETSLKCWGDNSYGEFGDGTTTSSTSPVTIPGLSGIKGLSIYRNACAVLAVAGSNSIKCWGAGDRGQLGNGSYANSQTPVAVDSGGPAVADTTPPTAPGSFTGVPASPTKQTGATIGFALGEAGGTVECRVDSGSWGSCTGVSGTSGSLAVSGLADGSHTVSVRQTDAAGNVSSVGTSDSWTIDSIAPSAPVLTVAPVTTSAAVSFTAEAGASFTCSVDGGSYASCTSPQSLTGLSVGPHSFAVKATDAAGNTSGAATVSWTVAAPPLAAPTILTPAADTKTVYRANVGGKNTWVMKLGLLFSTSGDTRGAAQLLTVQVAVDSAGRPVSARPSDSKPLPTAAEFTQGVVSWNPSGETARSTIDAPVWVRVGNRAGKWTGWVRLTP